MVMVQQIYEPAVTLRPLVFLNFFDMLSTGNVGFREVLDVFNEDRVDEASEMWSQLFDKDAHQNLDSLNAEFAPEYVITSEWTAGLSESKIRIVLQHTGLQFVAENLHKDWKTLRTEGRKKGGEIQWWFDDNPRASGRPFVILDNGSSRDSLSRSPFRNHADYCQISPGLTANKLVEAREILKQPRPQMGARK